MKRLALTLVAGAFGTLMALPIAQAQVMNPNNDAGSVPGDRTYNQASKETVEDYQNNAGDAATTSSQVDVQKRTENVQGGDMGATTDKQVDIQKRTENVQSGDMGATTDKQVDVQKRSDSVQNDALGTDSTQKQVDIQKRSDVQGGAFGPTTHEQVDVQKRSDSESMNNTVPNTAPDANQ
jgi:hypothetical protein